MMPTSIFTDFSHCGSYIHADNFIDTSNRSDTLEYDQYFFAGLVARDYLALVNKLFLIHSFSGTTDKLKLVRIAKKNTMTVVSSILVIVSF
jgi:hypothetical protein